MKTEKLTKLSLLTAAALVLYLIEMRLPGPVPIPGVKLGLANVITVVSLYHFSGKETAMLLFTRILLGSLFAGNASAWMFSVAGGCLCFAGMYLLCRVIPRKYMWLNSMFGAVFHNVGQMGAAVFVMGSLSVMAYLPVLLLSGCITGVFTGLCARAVSSRLWRGSKEGKT